MDITSSFPTDYQDGRAKFLAAASEAGGEMDAFAHPLSGPDGAPLFTDVGWFGPRDARRVLVVLSGTHGVEGFCGSGSQVSFLRRGGVGLLSSGTALMMVHAVNPYGFAWLRRVTDENIDLNRNWIDFTAALPENDGYEALHPDLCPAEWTQETIERGVRACMGFAAARGMKALQNAISAGQYRHPDGLFYGGLRPSWSRVTQTLIFERYLGQCAAVGIIDLHSGLGPRGYGERICAAPRASDAHRRALAWYGAAITSVMDGTAVAADVVGDGASAAAGLLPHAEVTAMSLEFGTIPEREVLLALQADNWLHAHGEPLAPSARSIKKTVRDAFYIEDPQWQAMIVAQSDLACRQALAGLSA
jgi:hypothetical protein